MLSDLSNNFPSLYLRLDNFPKNYVKVGSLFCPPGISIVDLRYLSKFIFVYLISSVKSLHFCYYLSIFRFFNIRISTSHNCINNALKNINVILTRYFMYYNIFITKTHFNFLTPLNTEVLDTWDTDTVIISNECTVI